LKDIEAEQDIDKNDPFPIDVRAIDAYWL